MNKKGILYSVYCKFRDMYVKLYRHDIDLWEMSYIYTDDDHLYFICRLLENDENNIKILSDLNNSLIQIGCDSCFKIEWESDNIFKLSMISNNFKQICTYLKIINIV